jgi:rsbT co-antagonist protein RsbR
MSRLSVPTRELLESYGVQSSDLARIRAYGEHVRPRVPEFVAAFYVWLQRQPEFAQHFTDAGKLARVKKLQEDYWADFFNAQVDDDYLSRRRRIGEVHARIGLGLPVYFAAMHFSLVAFTDTLYDGRLTPADYAEAVRAITKMVHLDTAVVVETYSRMTNEKIADQSRALMEMSTPVTAIWQGMLLLPVVGIIDSRRAQDLMNAMLGKIAQTGSRIFILDISGVAVVDTAVANHLIKITKATKLMGCECTLSGISPAIAQTVVELGIDVGEIRTTANLRDALEDAFRRTGVELQVKNTTR